MAATDHEARSAGALEVLLPNGSDGDALVLVRSLVAGWCVAFDAGDPSRVPERDVLRLRHLLISHCHVDHFVGFDALLRPRVCRPDTLTVHGPPGLLDRVAARLSGYTWNLVEGNHFVVEAREMRGDRVLRARFDSGREFVREDLPPADPGATRFGSELDFRHAVLDHHVVSMGWALELPQTWHVRPDAVAARGLVEGPWLGELKRLVAEGADAQRPFQPPGGDAMPLLAWRDALLLVRRGERVAYVTDTICAAHTRPLVVGLAAAADVFACGAPFLDEDAERARSTRHLTARQAGEMAAEAGARELLLFHVSDRYGGEYGRHVDEAVDGSRGRVDVRVMGPLPRRA
jgi:ribonuclease Z